MRSLSRRHFPSRLHPLTPAAQSIRRRVLCLSHRGERRPATSAPGQAAFKCMIRTSSPRPTDIGIKPGDPAAIRARWTDGFLVERDLRALQLLRRGKEETIMTGSRGFAGISRGTCEASRAKPTRVWSRATRRGWLPDSRCAAKKASTGQILSNFLANSCSTALARRVSGDERLVWRTRARDTSERFSEVSEGRRW